MGCRWSEIVAGIGGVLACVSLAQASVPAQIVQPIDDARRVVLSGNTRPEAKPRNDRGMLPDNTRIGGMDLLLRRPSSTEEAFERVIADLHNPQSGRFHHWLKATEIGRDFGVSGSDVAKVVRWLRGYGFSVRGVTPDHTVIEFSGTAGEVRNAFHTELHQLSVKGTTHFANMSDPQIPAALAPVVVGVVALHDFRPHPMFVQNKKMPGPDESVSSGCFPAAPTNTSASYTGECLLVTPADLATIYNINPVFSAGITGKGQTVVVLEDTDVFKPGDWVIFRDVMGLSNYPDASFTEVHPSGTLSCADPGVVNGNAGEAILDAEYASASAPDAAIELASCSDTGTNNTGFGGYKALVNITGLSSPPKIVSLSYGECEAEDGATSNAAFSTVYQTAASEGISVYVSSGDESATSCDANATAATHGIGVSGFASTSYNIAVGGTDFADTGAPISGSNESPTFWETYWSGTNGTNWGSALSYIPEIPWNDSCASELQSKFYGYSATYGTTGFCNSTFGKADFLTTGSGSGGPSGCATGTPTTTGVVSGTCAGNPKPSWQAGFAGIVNDNVRDIPDVSLFAANGVWGHWYPFCDHNPNDFNPAEAGCTTLNPYNWGAAGGTSFASPIWAGIQALINQKTGKSWGNTNVQFYQLAAAEYGAGGNANCNSSLGNGVASSCVFNDVTAGDFNVNCKALSGTLHNCYLPSGTNGVGTVTNGSYQPMYRSATGWDFTTGIGTPNVANLLNAMAGL